MLRIKYCMTAAALALTTAPAMATSFIVDPITNPSTQWQGIDSWGVQVTPFSMVDQVLTFNVLGDSKIDLYMLGSPKFRFSDVLLNGTSIASDFTLSSSNFLLASGYVPSGATSLEFKGDYTCKDCWGDWFGGYVQVTRATIPASTAAVPEPATWASLLVGFGFIGAAMRRRHRAALLAA